MIRAERTGAPADPARRVEYRDLIDAWGIRPRLADLLAGRLDPEPAAAAR
jgi:hypothetical protein